MTHKVSKLRYGLTKSGQAVKPRRTWLPDPGTKPPLPSPMTGTRKAPSQTAKGAMTASQRASARRVSPRKGYSGSGKVKAGNR